MTLATEPQTPMGWKLFLVDRDLSNEEITSTFAEIFEIDQDDVLLIEETDDISEDLPKNIQLVCERSIVKGDFQISISVYPQDIVFDGEVEIIELFSNILNCKCLILDPGKENLNDEDACLLIQGVEGYIDEVYLNTERLDQDEYIILKSEESEDEDLILTEHNKNSELDKGNIPQNATSFHLIDMDRYYFLYEYQGRIINLPKDVAIEKGNLISTVLSISQATYKDTNEPISANDSTSLKDFLIAEAQQEDNDIIIE